MHLLLQTSLPPERALRKKEYSLSLSTVIFPLYSKTVSPLTLLSPAFCCEFYHLLLLIILLLLQNSSQITQSERDGQSPQELLLGLEHVPRTLLQKYQKSDATKKQNKTQIYVTNFPEFCNNQNSLSVALSCDNAEKRPQKASCNCKSCPFVITARK